MSRGIPSLDRRQLLKIFGAVAAAGATGGLVACTDDDPLNNGRPLSGRTIRVGLVAPSSGPYARVGEEIRRGFMLYLESNNMLLGPHNVSVVTVDEGETVESAVAAVASLLSQGVVAIAGVANPDALPEIATAVQARQVPLVASNVAPATLTNALFVWRTSYQMGHAGESLAEYALQQGSRAYVMHDDTSTGLEEAARFEVAFEDLGGTVVTGSSSISGMLSDALSRDVDSIFAAYSGDGAVQVLTALQEHPSHPKLLGPASLTETIDLVALRGLPQEVYTSNFYAPDLDNAANRRFVTDYHRAHSAQPTGYAMAAYDGAAVLSRAVSLAGTEPTGADINREFSSLGQIESPRGTWTFNINRSPQQKWYLRRLSRDGQVPSNLLDLDLMVLG